MTVLGLDLAMVIKTLAGEMSSVNEHPGDDVDKLSFQIT